MAKFSTPLISWKSFPVGIWNWTRILMKIDGFFSAYFLETFRYQQIHSVQNINYISKCVEIIFAMASFSHEHILCIEIKAKEIWRMMLGAFSTYVCVFEFAVSMILSALFLTIYEVKIPFTVTPVHSHPFSVTSAAELVIV